MTSVDQAQSNYLECPIESVRPFAMMIAPVYVYMKLNQKYVKVKSPLDFFTEEDLARLRSFETFYLPQESESALLYRQVGSDVRELLSWGSETRKLHELREKVGAAERHTKDQIALQLASYEISDAVIRLIAPLWNEGPSIDPFYVTVFVNELCNLLPGDTLKTYRDRSMVDYERAVVQSSLVVFLALHLGYVDLAFLNQLRELAMQEVMAKKARSLPSMELNELSAAASDSLGSDYLAAPGTLIHADQLKSCRFGIASEKISSRMRRVGRLAHV